MRAVRDTNNLSDLSEISISICWGREEGVVRSYNQRGVPIKVTVARKKKERKREKEGERAARFDWIAMTRDETNEWMNG